MTKPYSLNIPALQWLARQMLQRELHLPGRLMTRLLCVLTLSGAFGFLPTSAAAQARGDARNALNALSASVQALSAKVAPTVVQVLTTGYATTDAGDGRQADLVMGRHRSLGSGVIVDPEGYIVTNAHVVQGARRVQVVLHVDEGRGLTVDARIVGTTQELDL